MTLARGFTLLEWMLATTIGLFLLAGIFSLYVASRNNTHQLQTYNELQENGRLAMNLLLQDLGVWGAMEPKTNVRVYHRRSVPSSHAFASTLQLHKSASRFISDRS